MPPRSMTYREMEIKLKILGFSVISQKGSHVKFSKYEDGKKFTAIVPRHGNIPIGTIKSILRQAYISNEEFDNA